MAELWFTTTGEGETEVLGERLAGMLRAGDVLTLDGPLGAGKTRLVRGIARGLGVDERLVASPTYVIVHEYPAPSPVDPPLVHVDAYRLSGGDDLESLGWERVNDGSSIVVVEWGERVIDALQQTGHVARLFIRPVDDHTREVRLIAPKSWTQRGTEGSSWNRLVAGANQTFAANGGDAAPRAGAGVCPTCGKRVERRSGEAANETWPFCSDRCRMADLYKWFAGTYTLSRAVEEEDMEEA